VKKEGKRGKRIRRIARNKEGRMLGKGLRERGWMIMNGGIMGDEEAGCWTYMGGGEESVIDYILEEEQIREEMEYLEIRDRIELDHHPVIAWIRKGERRRNGGGKGRRVGRRYGMRGKRKLLEPG